MLVMNSYGATWFWVSEMAVLPLCCFFYFLLIVFMLKMRPKENTHHQHTTTHLRDKIRNSILKKFNKKQRPSSIQTPQLCIGSSMDQTLGVSIITVKPNRCMDGRGWLVVVLKYQVDTSSGHNKQCQGL